MHSSRDASEPADQKITLQIFLRHAAILVQIQLHSGMEATSCLFFFV